MFVWFLWQSLHSEVIKLMCVKSSGALSWWLGTPNNMVLGVPFHWVIWYTRVPYHQAVDNINGEMIPSRKMVLFHNFTVTPKFIHSPKMAPIHAFNTV